MIYDCFTFFNELDLLEIRLHTLDSVVDKFVLVESTRTFTNKEKPLHFSLHKERFSKFLHKIIHVVVDDFPQSDVAWDFEFHQRNAIARGLTTCAPEDVILISDVDEIPCPETVRAYATKTGVTVFKQKMFYYYVNNISISKPYWVNSATRMLTYGEFVSQGGSAQKTRFLKGRLVSPGGWHFSYLGGIDAILAKIDSWSHQEFNKEEYANPEKIRARVENGEDLFFDKNKNRYRAVVLDSTFPKYLVDNQKTYAHLIRIPNITIVDMIVLKYNLLKESVVLGLKQVKNKLLRKY